MSARRARVAAPAAGWRLAAVRRRVARPATLAASPSSLPSNSTRALACAARRWWSWSAWTAARSASWCATVLPRAAAARSGQPVVQLDIGSAACRRLDLRGRATTHASVLRDLRRSRSRPPCCSSAAAAREVAPRLAGAASPGLLRRVPRGARARPRQPRGSALRRNPEGRGRRAIHSHDIFAWIESVPSHDCDSEQAVQTDDRPLAQGAGELPGSPTAVRQVVRRGAARAGATSCAAPSPPPQPASRPQARPGRRSADGDPNILQAARAHAAAWASPSPPTATASRRSTKPTCSAARARA